MCFWLGLENMRDKVSGAQRWVVKIGSALLTADGKGLDRGAMAVWVEQMVALRAQGVELAVSYTHLTLPTNREV